MSIEYWRGLAERFENQRDAQKQRVTELEAVLRKIHTHQGFDENNNAMELYVVLCQCQGWAEEALESSTPNEKGQR